MKNIFFTIAIAVVIAGCQSTGVCDYPLFDEGWVRIKTPPVNLVDKYNKQDYWFTNSAGDFFACSELKKKGVCGNVYEIYKKQSDGTFKRQDIVCLT